MLVIDGERIWSSTHALFQKEAPARLVIVGAGAVGIEFADIYAAYGSKVTVVEMLDRILPVEGRGGLGGGGPELQAPGDGDSHRDGPAEDGDGRFGSPAHGEGWRGGDADP